MKNKLITFSKTVLDTAMVYLTLCSLEIRTYRHNKLATNEKQVLVLASALPPHVTGGSYRPMSWAKYASSNNWRITFLTKDLNTPLQNSKAGEHLANQMKGQSEIFRVKKPRLNPSWKLLPKVDGSFLDALATISLGLKLFNNNKPSVIVATGPSFDYFIAAYYLSKILGVPLVIDYRDEWTENPFPFVNKGKIDEYWEKRIFTFAKSIIFTTESMKQHHIKKYNRPDNIHVVTNGWEPSEHDPHNKIEKPDKVILTFVGNIASHNLPYDFIEDINSCYQHINKGIELKFVGHIPEQIKIKMLELDINNIIDFESFLPRNEANSRMQSCSALLLFNPPELARYLPGKVFDYLSAGRPIIVHGNEGETAKLIRKLTAGYFVTTGNTVELTKIINQLPLLSEHENIANSEDLLGFSRETLAAQFYGILDQVADED
jgi:hypothetical protein